MGALIRILRPGDEALLIQGVAMADEGSLSAERATIHLADDSLVAVAAVDAGQVVGFIYGHVLRRFEATSFFIYSVDVAESHHRRGIARAMFEALRRHGRAGHWDEMFVLTTAGNAAGMAFYESVGGVRPNPDDVMWDFYDEAF